MSFTGRCRCGKHRYRIRRRYLNAMHCYCHMCRQAHGTAFSTHLMMRPDQFEWVDSAAPLTAFESSPGAYRAFCSACGTHLQVYGQSGDDTLAVPAGTLDGAPAITIVGHMYTCERVSWHQITDNLPQYSQWPPGYGPTDSD
ncbi:MAG: GFA family protein [Pseudomonadota bacterium]